MTELQETYGVYPPIYVRNMQFSYDRDKAEFLEKYGLDEDLTAEEAFEKLRETYSIDEDLSDSEVRKIFRIREEVKSVGYNRYQSSTIAEDVSDETVVYIEEMSGQLPALR